jgi:hypothetical protein
MKGGIKPHSEYRSSTKFVPGLGVWVKQRLAKELNAKLSDLALDSNRG